MRYHTKNVSEIGSECYLQYFCSLISILTFPHSINFLSQMEVESFFFCYHTSHLYHVCLIDGAASIIINYMETLDHAIFSCLAPFFVTYHLMPRGRKKHLNIATFFAYADGGNRTRAASTASSRAIHYTIAPRLEVKSLMQEILIYLKLITQPLLNCYLSSISHLSGIKIG